MVDKIRIDIYIKEVHFAGKETSVCMFHRKSLYIYTYIYILYIYIYFYLYMFRNTLLFFSMEASATAFKFFLTSHIVMLTSQIVIRL